MHARVIRIQNETRAQFRVFFPQAVERALSRGAPKPAFNQPLSFRAATENRQAADHQQGHHSGFRDQITRWYIE